MPGFINYKQAFFANVRYTLKTRNNPGGDNVVILSLPLLTVFSLSKKSSNM